jgi:hypothetical protein
VTKNDLQDGDPTFGYSRFDGRPLHTESDREADSIRATLYSAGFRDFAVNPDDSGFSISTTNADTSDALHDPARFAEAMSSAGYSVTPDRDDDQTVMAWPTAENEAFAAAAFADWGGWRLDPQAATLEHAQSEYWIELTDCTDPAQVLDWIAQSIYKQRIDDAALAGLVRALDDILHLQATLCPQGDAKTLTVEEIQNRIAQVASTAPQSYLVSR